MRERKRPRRTRHPGYQKIEQYVLGRLGAPSDPAVVRLEEHLLICPACVTRAEDALEFAQVMRAALREQIASPA